MEFVSLNCKDGQHRACTGCSCPTGCHAVPPPDHFRAARQELAEKLAAKRNDTTEETS